MKVSVLMWEMMRECAQLAVCRRHGQYSQWEQMPDDERRKEPAEGSWAKLHTDAKSHGDYSD